MQNLFYRWAMDSKASYLDQELLQTISMIEEYDLFNNIKDGKYGKYVIIGEKPYFFKQNKENKSIYDMFIENLHIHISIGEKEKVYSIRIKKK